jgi:hypothetical protein
MMSYRSRRAILVNAMFAAIAIALGAPTVLAAHKVHPTGECTIHSDTRARQVDCTAAPQAAQPPKDVHDAFESMHQE